MSTGANRGTAPALGSASSSGAFVAGSTLSELLHTAGGWVEIVRFRAIAAVAALPFAPLSDARRERRGRGENAGDAVA